MSSQGSRHEGAIRKIRSHGVIIILVLLMPVLASAIVYLVASAAGAAGNGLPTIGYGLVAAVCSANGASFFWGSATGTCVAGSSPWMPTIVFNAINGFMVLGAALIAGISFITMLGALGELAGGED